MSRSIGGGLRHLGRHARPLWAASNAVHRTAGWLTTQERHRPRPRRIAGGLAARLFHAPVGALSASALDDFDYVVGLSERVEHVLVPCASSGSIIVSLYNVHKHPPTKPLLLYLPPSHHPPLDAQSEDGAVVAEDVQEAALQPPPSFLLRQNYPIAVIRYRWSRGEPRNGPDATQDPDQIQPPSYMWPRPLHDVMFAYDWIKKNLSPPLSASTRDRDGRRHFLRRDLYVYGSYLSAGLATSFALTETHPPHRVAIRGLAAYNGIYNWTAYVGMTADGIPVADDATAIYNATPGIRALPELFRRPSDLFDAFASPSLFFRTTGHLIAPLHLDRDISRRLLEEREARLDEEEAKEKKDQAGVQALGKRTFGMELLGTSRKAYLAFPPMKSTLSIPSALFLHTSPDEPPPSPRPATARKPGTRARPRKIPESTNSNNSFAVQADEMASLMRRGIDKVEIKRLQQTLPILLPEYTDNRNIEGDMEVRSSDAEKRVRVSGVDAPVDDSLELGEDGQAILLDWLDEHMDNDPVHTN
ncbi:hypothetical protein SPBR_02681 [Sporothrix brasiliensis 5110]|uniref:Uncharacterized protein n=1 Tax=Sporothrix brasiliensis 5110 TaxID=1398154 RepID=A0A0C2J691_9PEZI|nr:uncharacterized protein SPBR_02681 [Sporothrix brasiliensis 5110]KIH92562.1 hypothetical protein SPBR_02681 [Sporothrix brasiliensis 5110]